MTSKYEYSVSEFGSASPGFTKPVRIYEMLREGTNTHRDLLKHHRYTENPFTVTGRESINRQMSWHEPPGMQLRQCSTSMFGSWPVFDTVTTPQFTDVVPKLLEKWRQSSFDLGVTIGEGRESVQLITSRLGDIAKAATQLRKGNLGGALRTLSHVPKGVRRSAQAAISAGAFRDAWLELQYGWLPLLRDIHALSEFVKLDPKRNRVKARSSNRGGAKPYGSGIPQDRVHVSKNDSRLQLIVEVSSQPTLMERLGLTDPLSVGWNLAGWSFVVDWFAPIGDYLATLHAVNQMPVTACITTYSTKRDAICRVLPGDNFYGGLIERGGYSSRMEVSVSRTFQYSLPLAWMATAQTPKSVSGKYEPSLMRLANGAALASTVLRGLPQR